MPRRELTFLAAAVAGMCVATPPALAAPPFYGASFATTLNAGDPVIGSGGGAVRVDARLPSSLACSEVVSVRPGPGYHDNPGLDAFNAAPVLVTLAPGQCGAAWRQNRAAFTVPHPRTSDILELVFTDSAGRTLHVEKLAISTSGGSSGGGHDD